MASKRKVTISAHPHRPCGKVCHTQDCLANLQHSRVYHIASFEEEKLNFAKTNYKINDDACICLKCYRTISHAWKMSFGGTRDEDQGDEGASTSGVTPAKKKRRQKERPPCFLESVGVCSNVSAHKTVIPDWPTFVSSMGLEVHAIEPQEQVDLCLLHYNMWHGRDRHKRCNVCRTAFDVARVYSIPEYALLMAHCQEIGDDKANLSEDSKVCGRCYRSFKHLIQQLRSVSFGEKPSMDADFRTS
ncbi:hypothetical protein HOLleu_01946 [Holothuria leucospilota]|uniref:Uncharacterized protein n=1 Tax=Holothuria leucospilota TaxID=206669 RepID=A0A9Q1CQL2_HOLLE|nr:hypothetical protein HOLleu_01946 [Holothuria leucospilota]